MSEQEEVRLATWIRDGFTHPDRPLDDGFEIYASALDIAREIIAQRDAAPHPVPSPEPLDVERLLDVLRDAIRTDTESQRWRDGVQYAIDCIENAAAPQHVA